MNFEWKQLYDNEFLLFGYYETLIATLKWNGVSDYWEVESDFLNCSFSLDEDILRNHTEKAKLEALDKLKDACEEHSDWYKKQIEIIDK